MTESCVVLDAHVRARISGQRRRRNPRTIARVTDQRSPVKQAALIASLAVLLFAGIPVLVLTINTARRGLLTLEQMLAAVGLFGMGITFLFPIIFVGALFLLLYAGFFKGPALGAMIFPGLLSLWYVYDAVTKSEPYPWLAVAVLWVILWSIGFVTLFARKVGWKAGTALAKKLTAKSGSVVPAVAETAASAPPPPLEPH